MADIVVNGNTSGAVTLSAPAVAGTVTVTLPATSGTMAVLPTATGVLAESAGGTGTTTGYYGFKNRIINGAMVIDQRNAGASVTITNTGAGTYVLDRWTGFGTQASKFSLQQNAGSVTPPAGFRNYSGVTSLSAYSVAAGDFFNFAQAIEGYNMADLAWGTASAATVTLSFWVRSSLTGTFGGDFRNSAGDRNYPFTYTISSANTWEQKSVTIAGDTTGTWLTTNGVGVTIIFGLGIGSTYSGPAGAWSSNNYIGATGAISVVGTNGATWYITGVQLEKGSTATSFDYRPYGTELALCQRYCAVWTAVGSNIPIGSGAGQAIGSAQALLYLTYPVTPRVPATGISTSGTFSVYTAAAGGSALTSLAYNNSSNTAIQLNAIPTTANLVQGNSTSLIGTSAQITATGMEL